MTLNRSAYRSLHDKSVLLVQPCGCTGTQTAELPSCVFNLRLWCFMQVQGIYAQHEEFRTADGSSSRVGQGFSLDGQPPGMDCNGHGTHISGTAAGLTFGIAKNAWIHPCEPFPKRPPVVPDASALANPLENLNMRDQW